MTYILMHELKKMREVEFLSTKSITSLEITDLRCYIENKGIGVIVYQNGGNPYYLRKIKESNPDIPCITCCHQTPDAVSIYYNLRNILWRTLKRKAGFGEILLNLARCIFFPIWYKNTINKLNEGARATYELSDRFILLSERFKTKAIKNWHLKSTAKLQSIGNPLTYTYTPERSLSLLSQKKGILIVSRLEECQKRITLAMKAWKIAENQLPADCKLYIVGDGNDADTLNKYANKLGLKRVIFCGAQRPVDYYKKCALFLMTSAYEGWGLTLTEAQQFGVVPIAMDSYESLRDIIDHNNNGIIVSDGDYTSMAYAIIKLIQNDIERFRLAHNAVLSCARFTAQATATKWEQLIKELTQL